MKSFFGQKSQIPKAQTSPLLKPSPADQLPRIVHSKGQSDDPNPIPSTQAPPHPGLYLREESQSASQHVHVDTSSPATSGSDATGQHPGDWYPYDGFPYQSNHQSLQSLFDSYLDLEKEREEAAGMAKVRDHDQSQNKNRKRSLLNPFWTKDKGGEHDALKYDGDRANGVENGVQAEVTPVFGYLTSTEWDTWSLVLELCNKASASEAAARDASKMLKKAFKNGGSVVQLSATRLWAIMLRNSSEDFIIQTSHKEFLGVLDKVLRSSGTSPGVRERLLHVLAAAAFTHPGREEAGYRALWKRVKSPDQPTRLVVPSAVMTLDRSFMNVQGIPFSEDDPLLNPPNTHGPDGGKGWKQLPKGTSNPPSVRGSHKHLGRKPLHESILMLSKNEAMQRLFEECKVGKGNAKQLAQALTSAQPDEMNEPSISELFQDCWNSHRLIVAQIPWAAAHADHSRRQLRALHSQENSQRSVSFSTSKEEELLAVLIDAKQDLLGAFSLYEDSEKSKAPGKDESGTKQGTDEANLDGTETRFAAESIHQIEPIDGNGFVEVYVSSTDRHTPSQHLGMEPPSPALQDSEVSQVESRSRTPSSGPPMLSGSLVPNSDLGFLGIDIDLLGSIDFGLDADPEDQANENQGSHPELTVTGPVPPTPKSPPSATAQTDVSVDLPGKIVHFTNTDIQLPASTAASPSNHKLDLERVPNLTGRIKIVKGPLRAGGFCDIFSGEFMSERGTEVVAMKMLRVFNTEAHVVKAKKRLRREVNLWCSLRHDHVLPFYGTCELDDIRLFMVSPWAEEGNSLEYLRRNPSADRGRILWQTSSALEYLHSGRDAAQIVHGDLKADNVLISAAGDALLCDFGLSRYVEEIMSKSGSSSAGRAGGHARFTAPELLVTPSGALQPSRPTPESDVFAFASLMLQSQIYTEKLPFGDLPEIQAILKLARGKLPPRPLDAVVLERGFNDQIWRLMVDCWNLQPAKRPNMEEIRRRMALLGLGPDNSSKLSA